MNIKRMTVVITLTVIFILLSSVNVAAANKKGDCGDNLTWKYDGSTLTTWIPGTQHYVLRNPPIATSDPELPIMA